MKIRMLIAATLAGMLAVGAFAAPIGVDMPVADEAPLFADASCDGSHCLDDTASQPSDFAAVFWAPADEMAPPLDAGSIYYAAPSSPDIRAPLYYAGSSSPGWRAPMGDIKDVPEPGTLLLLGSALLLLSWRQIAQRR